MAEHAAMTFLLKTLMQVLQEHAQLIMNVDTQVEDLDGDLRLLQAILADEDRSSSIHRQKATLREVNRQIRIKVYQIQDAIDNFVAQTFKIQKHKFWRFVQAPATFLDVSKKVDAIRKGVEHVRNLAVQAGDSEPQLEDMIKSPGLTRDKVVVGFQEEQEKVINCLREETEELDVIPIIGMPGLGKTTLADKIFTDPMIESVFKRDRSRCIWINVSHEHYRKKDVLLSILGHFTKVSDVIRQRDEHVISEIVLAHLSKLHKFLIVMDDVWSSEVWSDFQGIFLKAQKGGKILITTQVEEVARSCNFTRDPLRLRLLTPYESWDLLKLEAFVNSISPPECLERQGQLIAEKCGGLPLLILLIGKILKGRCRHGGMLENQHLWEKVSVSLSSCLDAEDFQKINTSFYYKIPHNLRQLFLYAAMFPDGFEIPVRTLIRLWIAEGFIRQVNDESLEETARTHLSDLINRNLVPIAKRGLDGHIKTCRIHCFLRLFCVKEASTERQNIFQEMKYIGENKFEPSSNLAEHRRICIDSNFNDFFSSHRSCPLVHSLMCFSKDELQRDNSSSIPQALKYLRILEAKLITFKRLPKGWKELALLKCVVLSIDFNVIPEFISQLCNMQTLIVCTTSPELQIKANVWKMSQLRHVETNVSTILPNPKKGEKDGQLHTLGMISTQSCSEDVFDQLGNLRKLGIRGQLETLLVKANGLDALHELEKLKLVNDMPANTPTSDGDGVQQQRQRLCTFPTNLRALTLCATILDWSHMSTLGYLTKLEVLKLKDNAFKGETWVASAGGFSQLQILHIVEHNELVNWEASVNPFPILRCLMLSNCSRLERIPSSLAGNSLERLNLKGHADDSSIVASAWRIKERKRDLLLETS